MKPASSASRRVDEDFVRAHSRLTYPEHRLLLFPPFAKPAKDGAPHSLPVHANLKTGPPVHPPIQCSLLSYVLRGQLGHPPGEDDDGNELGVSRKSFVWFHRLVTQPFRK